MGSPVPPSEIFGRQNEDRQRARRDVNDALRIDGSQFVRLYEKMQALIAGIEGTVTTLVSALTYTKAETDAKVATPGDIAPGNVTASGNVSSGGSITATGNITSSGQVTSAAALKSLGSHSYVVSSGYVGAWINDDGTIGRSPSTLTLKKNLMPMGEESPAGIDAERALLGLRPFWGHYTWDDDGAPLKSFLLAEDVHAAGFGPDIAPLDEDGEPFTVNYSQLVPPLLAALQAEVRRGEERDRQIADLQAALAA